MSGMAPERRAVVEAIEQFGARPVWFEGFGGRDDDPEGAYLSEVATSDIYLGILGERYGRPAQTGYSATHAEYIEAARRGLRISVWNTAAELDGRQSDFLAELRVFHTTGTYSGPDDLGRAVGERLHQLASQAISPWVKIGDLVVRSTSLESDGATLRIVTRVRDRSIARAIDALRPDQDFGRSELTRISWRADSTQARVTSVRSNQTSSGATTFTIEAQRVDERRSTMMDVTYEQFTPDMQTELAARIALLGEPNPLGMMSYLVEADDPLAGLEDLQVSEDAIGAIAEVLVTEFMVGQRRVDHLTHFLLGPSNRGERAIELRWMSPRRYSNVEPEERGIGGHRSG